MALVGRKIGVDLLQEELGWVDVERDGMADGVVVGGYGVDGSEIMDFAAREEEELVEDVEGGGRGLMDACDDDELG